MEQTLNQAPSAATPVTAVEEKAASLRRPAGLMALAGGVSGVAVFLLGHAVSLEQVIHVARAGWKEIALGLVLIALLVVLRHVHQLHVAFVDIAKMFATAVASNQRVNEAQNEVLAAQGLALTRIERTLTQMQAQ